MIQNPNIRLAKAGRLLPFVSLLLISATGCHVFKPSGWSKLPPANSQTGLPSANPEGQKSPETLAAPSDLTPEHEKKLSSSELEALQKQPAESPQRLIVIEPSGATRVVETTAAQAERTQDRILAVSPGATVVADFPVEMIRESSDPVGQVDKQFLYSGKEEFGIREWNKKHPAADGRGVKIAVVDDGVSLGRPGLLKKSTGTPKIQAVFNTSPVWHLPLRTERLACANPVNTAAEASKSWVITPNVAAQPLSAAKLSIPFDITPCGINPELSGRARSCAVWDKTFANADKRLVDGVLRIPAVYAEFDGAKDGLLFVDADGDGQISNNETLSAVSSDNQKFLMLKNGTALGFDVHTTKSLGEIPVSIDNPTACVGLAAPEKTLVLVVPELSTDFGSHGEGVATIAAGTNIANQGFDGVAPGAAVVDVHFADNVGARQYTIFEVGRVLKLGGENADIVNLSYSLFFQTAASQVAMGRYLTALLGKTNALYFFSAGNNGPGRGSMNRSLLYPSFGIPVGAYLTPEMAQATFGSALPIGGVVTYSSRGPGVDGGSGPLVISPLAGIVASTPDSGFGPFSGTSSATPALAGFAARVVSQIKAEGLAFTRDQFRQALVESAKPIAGFAFVDQGHGLPNLTRTMDIYREKLNSKKTLPTFDVNGGLNPQGVARRGIVVRDQLDRLAQYTFAVAPKFDATWAEQDQANYSEPLKVVSSADWIDVPPTVFASRAGTSIQVAPRFKELEKLGGGEYLAHLRIENADTGALRAVIPVTVLMANSKGASYVNAAEAIPALGEKRLFLNRPSWATHLVVVREITDANQPLCGRFGLYNPSSVRLANISTAGSPVRREEAFAAPQSGLYEYVIEGRNSHTVCAEDQTVNLSMKWVQLEVSSLGTTAGKADATIGIADIKVNLQVATQTAPYLAGSIVLSDISEQKFVTLNSLPNEPWRLAGPSLDLSAYSSVRFGTDVQWARARGSVSTYQYWRLDLVPEKGNPWSVGVSLDLTGDAFSTVKITDDNSEGSISKAEASAVDPYATAFDFGLDRNSQSVKSIPLMMLGVMPATAEVKTTLDNVAARAGTPTALTMSFTADPKALSDKVMLCSFKIAGTELSIPCGIVPML